MLGRFNAAKDHNNFVRAFEKVGDASYLRSECDVVVLMRKILLRFWKAWTNWLALLRPIRPNRVKVPTPYTCIAVELTMQRTCDRFHAVWAGVWRANPHNNLI